jgi:O-antigen ligase
MFATLAWSDYPTELMTNLAHNLGLFFVCMMLCDVFEGDYKRFLWVLLLNVSVISALSVIVAVLWPDIGIIYDTTWGGLHSEFSSNGRWSGITDGPNSLGIFAALGLITGVYLLVECKKESQRISSRYFTLAILATFLANSVALIGSDSKTSLSSAVSALLFYFFARNVLGWFQHKKLKYLSTNFIVGLAATIGLVAIIKATEADKLLFAEIGRDSELTGRTWLWKLGWDAISERPITGWSFDYFYTLKDTYGAFEYNQFHNALIDLLAKGGIIALIIGLIIHFDFISKLDRGDEKRHAVQFAVLYLPFLLVSSYAEARLFRPECFVWFIFIFCWFYLLRRTRASTSEGLAYA